MATETAQKRSPLDWAGSVAFFTLAILCCSTYLSGPLGLALGMTLALTLGNPHRDLGKKYSGPLLRICVVLLGFSMNLWAVLKAGADGMVFAAVTIISTLALSALLGKWLKIGNRVSALIGSGTAICGGSAIAAVGSVLGAEEGEMSVAMGTVFLLNAVGLYLFPALGHALGLSAIQFGTWAGVAIHDISSVVGASSVYDSHSVALQTATAVKLSRTLWIIPLAVGAALLVHRLRQESDAGRAKIQIPWFIGLFLLASLANTLLPSVSFVAPSLAVAAKAGLALTLFLIGAGLSRSTLASVGWKPMAQGVILWAFISSVALFVVMRMF